MSGFEGAPTFGESEEIPEQEVLDSSQTKEGAGMENLPPCPIRADTAKVLADLAHRWPEEPFEMSLAEIAALAKHLGWLSLHLPDCATCRADYEGFLDYAEL